MITLLAFLGGLALGYRWNDDLRLRRVKQMIRREMARGRTHGAFDFDPKLFNRAWEFETKSPAPKVYGTYSISDSRQEPSTWGHE